MMGMMMTRKVVEPKRKAVTTKEPMKPLYWKRLQLHEMERMQKIDPKKTFWNDIEEPEIDTEELTSFFSKVDATKRKISKDSDVKAKKEKKAENEAATAKKETKKLLDQKRSQAIGIFMRSFKITSDTIEKCIDNFGLQDEDGNNLSPFDFDSLKSLNDLKGTKEEMTNLNEYENLRKNDEKQEMLLLDAPEIFLIKLRQIKKLDERIFCFNFQDVFTERTDEIKKNLTILERTITALSDDKSELFKILAYILAVGNYLNGGNKMRGQADGFTLEVLSKLQDLKAHSGQNLLTYIIVSFLKKYKNEAEEEELMVIPVPPVNDILKSSDVEFGEIEGELNKLNKQMEKCQGYLSNIDLTLAENENLKKFKENLGQFLDQSGKIIKEISDLNASCKEKFNETCISYCVVAKKRGQDVSCKDFFHYWSQFCSSFKDIWEKEVRKLLKERAILAKKKVEELRNNMNADASHGNSKKQGSKKGQEAKKLTGSNEDQLSSMSSSSTSNNKNSGSLNVNNGKQTLNSTVSNSSNMKRTPSNITKNSVKEAKAGGLKARLAMKKQASLKKDGK